MKDRVVQHANRYKLTPVSGDIYDLTPEPGIVTEQGTNLNKANLLSDTTAALIGGLGSDPTINAALAALAPRAKIGVLSYVGTGTSGSANPNTVIFSFVPKIAFLAKRTNTNNLATATFVHGSTNALGYGASGSTARPYPLIVSWNDTTPSLSWYCLAADQPHSQGNESGETYDVVYLG